jgi:hypothetical protein
MGVNNSSAPPTIATSATGEPAKEQRHHRDRDQH